MVLSPNPISFDKGGFFDFDKDDFFCHAKRPAAVDFIWPYVCLFDPHLPRHVPTYRSVPPGSPPLPAAGLKGAGRCKGGGWLWKGAVDLGGVCAGLGRVPIIY